LVYSGGVGEISDIIKAKQIINFDGIALSYLLHIKNISIKEIKEELMLNKIQISNRS